MPKAPLLLFFLSLAVVLAACGNDGNESPSKVCVPKETKTDDTSGCTGDNCIGDPWSSAGEFGDPCKLPEECMTGICGQDTQSGAQFCTQTCNPSDNPPCPQAAECLPTGDGQDHVCAPPPC
jgi:hypothetical protein